MASSSTSPPTTSKLNFIAQCRLAEAAERYEDMISIVKSAINNSVADIEFSTDERNLFSIAFKNVVGLKRSSWRIVRAIEDVVISEGATDPVMKTIGGNLSTARKLQLAKEYRDKIKLELCSVAHELLELLDTKLIPSTKDVESKVFYAKMKADYNRYLAEVSEGEDRGVAIGVAKQMYAEALELCKENMHPTHPIRLGLVLNYSVFFYEILGDKAQAQALAKSAFDSAISQLDNLSEESYKDSTLVLQLIRDNLGLWSNESQAQEFVNNENEASNQDMDNLAEALENSSLEPEDFGVGATAAGEEIVADVQDD